MGLNSLGLKHHTKGQHKRNIREDRRAGLDWREEVRGREMEEEGKAEEGRVQEDSKGRIVEGGWGLWRLKQYSLRRLKKPQTVLA